MVKRLSMMLVIMILAVITLFLAAKNPTGPNTVSFDEPQNFLTSLGTLIVLLLPPLILAFFNHVALNIISAVYQAFIVLTFLGVVIVGLVIPSILISIIGGLGTIVGIISIVMTLFDLGNGMNSVVVKK